ncbi:hypothetical protein [Mesorhizobium sp. ORS 3428]|uniref:hypothetical protein n=1 Tax=Mesorhizobium sp. ORS 3428 TaxID=540997 RepID=UPI0010427A46|nr:hypothetical protein [Mesorhizobium sp. ORS 3428]
MRCGFAAAVATLEPERIAPDPASIFASLAFGPEGTTHKIKALQHALQVRKNARRCRTTSAIFIHAAPFAARIRGVHLPLACYGQD